MTQRKQNKKLWLILSLLAHALISTLIGGGTGFLIAFIFYSGLLQFSMEPLFIWKSWHYFYYLIGFGCLSGFIGGLCFCVLFFRPNIGRLVFLKTFLFSLLSLVTAAAVFAIMMHQYKHFFIIGYQIAFFVFFAFIPWFLIGIVSFWARKWTISR